MIVRRLWWRFGVRIDLNIESQSDLLGDTRTAPRWIPLLHLDNRCNDFRARSFWARLLPQFEREQ